MKLSKEADYSSYLYTCNKCRSCIHPGKDPSRTTCPAFLYRGFITFSGAGKLYTAQGIIEGIIPLKGRELGEVIYTCMNCQACAVSCPSALPVREAIRDLRETFYTAGGRTEEILGIEKNMERAGNPWGMKIKCSFPAEGDVNLFPGCSYLILYPETVERVVKILKGMGISAGIPYIECCGAPLLEIGARKEFEKRAEAFFNTMDGKPVYFMDPHCLWAMKNYAEEKGIEAKLHSAIELLMELPQTSGEGIYHDSCRMGRFLGLYDLPREVLKKRGVRIIEPELTRELSFCCGGNWGARRGLAEFTRKKRVEELKKLQKSVIIACPLCRKSFEKAKLNVIDIYAL